MKQFMIDIGVQLAETEVTETPSFKVLCMLAEQFRKYSLPIRYVGRVKINVNENFFEDEKQAKEFIDNIGKGLANIYAAVFEEFGEEEADYIFGDMASGFSIKYT